MNGSTEVKDVKPTVTDNGDNTWTVSYSNLPKYAGGTVIAYSVKEDSVSGYTADAETVADGGTLTNTHKVKSSTTPTSETNPTNTQNVQPSTTPTSETNPTNTQKETATTTPSSETDPTESSIKTSGGAGTAANGSNTNSSGSAKTGDNSDSHQNREKEWKILLSILVLVFFVIALFKLTALFFRVVGKLLGWIIGVIGWLFLAGLAVTVLGLAAIAAPVVLIIGFIALIAAAAA